MGTRNLTMVIDQKGQTKIAQYGQWDGYPSGQGLTILQFIRETSKLHDLQIALNNIKFYNRCDDISEYLKQYEKKAPEWSDQPDNRTEKDKYWFGNLVSRNVGGGILQSIIDINLDWLPREHNRTIYLYDDSEFGKDGLFCEFAYIVNLQTNKFIVLKGLNNDKSQEYGLFATTQSEVDERCKGLSDKYYGCCVLKEYSLNALPNDDDFVTELDNLIEERSEE